MNARPLNVAVIGAGPAGIYASDILSKSGLDVSIDLFERLPAPYGLVRYGVAPDHPRIKGIITSLHRVLDTPQIRLLGNIDYLLGCGPFRKWPTVSFDTWERQGATLLSADIVDCLNKLKEAAELAVQRGGSLVFFGD